MDPLPDLTTLSDEGLVSLLEERAAEEDAISKRRRLLHGRIDLLRHERTARLKAQLDAGETDFSAPSTLDRPLYAGSGEVPADDELGPLPDLATISDDELRGLIGALEQEEDDISLGRRFLQGQVDILRAERALRARGGAHEHVAPGDLGGILQRGPDRGAPNRGA